MCWTPGYQYLYQILIFPSLLNIVGMVIVETKTKKKKKWKNVSLGENLLFRTP